MCDSLSSWPKPGEESQLKAGMAPGGAPCQGGDIRAYQFGLLKNVLLELS